jgi:hypothetical protein
MSTLEDRTFIVLAYITAVTVAKTRYAYIENRDVPDLAEALRKFMDAEVIPIDLEASAEYLGEVELDVVADLYPDDIARPPAVRVAVAAAVADEITKTACAFVDESCHSALAKALATFLEAKNIRSFPKAAVKHFNELEALPDLEDTGDEHKGDLLTEEGVVSLLTREGIIGNLKDDAGDLDEDADDPGMKDD